MRTRGSVPNCSISDPTGVLLELNFFGNEAQPVAVRHSYSLIHSTVRTSPPNG